MCIKPQMIADVSQAIMTLPSSEDHWEMVADVTSHQKMGHDVRQV